MIWIIWMMMNGSMQENENFCGCKNKRWCWSTFYLL